MPKKNVFDIVSPTTYILIALLISLMAMNQYLLYSLNAGAPASTASSSSPNLQLTGDPTSDAVNLIISRGVPPVYGSELGVSFDNVVPSMNVLASLDPTYGSNKISLSGADLQRYIKIGTTPTMTCEFCCGAKTMVFQDGSAACGCAHSQAMRGVAAYMIKNHGSEVTDEQIMQQVAKWKAMYFPKQMVARFLDESKTGQYTPDIASILLGVDTAKLNITGADLSKSLGNAPNMVGGC